MSYFHQLDDWPKFGYDKNRLEPIISEINTLDTKLKTLMSVISLEHHTELEISVTITEIVKNFEIESVRLNTDDVRASLIKKLGLETELSPTNRNIDGYVEASVDAIKNADSPLTTETLCKWHNCLFHKGINEYGKEIIVGKYRTEKEGPMTVMSGTFGVENIHYVAPTGEKVLNEMDRFLQWYNNDKTTLPFIKSAIAHLWFVSIHPFDDGNGRISRIISDKAISSSNKYIKYYSVSEQIQANKQEYYAVLNKTSKQTNLNITDFISWYSTQTLNALKVTEQRIEKIFVNVHFWDKIKTIPLNDRQLMCLKKILSNEIYNKMNRSKYATFFNISNETASRDLLDLESKKVLTKLPAGGRETAYYLKELGLPIEKKFGEEKQKGFSL